MESLKWIFALAPQASHAVQAAIADSSPFYREFKIPKRRGGWRNINAPYPFLDELHRGVLRRYLSALEFPLYVCAYVSGRSALNHAALHLGAKQVLSLDVKNFFPSITRQMVFEVFEELGCDPVESNVLSRLCTLYGGLPQGACTSPPLSNLVFSKVDKRLEGLARHYGLTYSRYADDLVFSGEKIPAVLIKVVSNILLSECFELNHEKTMLKGAGARKIVTGISISGENLKAPKSFKRALRAEVHRLEHAEGRLFSVFGADSLVYERALGRLNYLLQIEPGNDYALSKKKVLSEAHQRFLSKKSKFVSEEN